MPLATAALFKSPILDSRLRRNTNFPDGLDPGAGLEINFTQPSPQSWTQGTPNSYNTDDNVSGISKALGTTTATILASTISGLSITSGSVASYSGTGTGTATVRFLWTHTGDPTIIRISDLTLSITVSAAPVGSDVTDPPIPIRLAVAEALVSGNPGFSFACDPVGDVDTNDGAPSSTTPIIRVYRSPSTLIGSINQSAGAVWRLTGSDIGTVGAAGSTTPNGTGVTVVGNGQTGGGLNTTGEYGHYATFSVTGDNWVFSATLDSLSAPSGNKYALFRVANSLAANAACRHIFYDATKSRARDRVNAGDTTTTISAGNTHSLPVQYRALKIGGTLTTEINTGSGWVPIDPGAGFVAASTVYLSLVTTTNTGGAVQATAVWSQVNIQSLPRITGEFALTPGTYPIFSRSFDGTNESANSEEIEVTIAPPPDTTAPTVPGTPTVTGTSDSTANISWAASTDTESGLQKYQLYRDTSAGGAFATLAGEPTTNSFGDSGLAASTTYYYKVRAVDNGSPNNVSAFSAIGSGATLAAPGPGDVTPPSTPSILTAGPNGQKRIDITYSAATDASGIAQYFDHFRPLGSTTWSSYRNAGDTPITGTSFSFTEYPYGSGTALADDTDYEIRVRAQDASSNANIGEFSQIVVARTLAAPPPPPADDLDLNVRQELDDDPAVRWSVDTSGNQPRPVGFTECTTDHVIGQYLGYTKSRKIDVIANDLGSGGLSSRYRIEEVVNNFDQFGPPQNRAIWICVPIFLLPDWNAGTDPNIWTELIQMQNSQSAGTGNTLTCFTLTHDAGAARTAFKIYGRGETAPIAPVGNGTRSTVWSEDITLQLGVWNVFTWRLIMSRGTVANWTTNGGQNGTKDAHQGRMQVWLNATSSSDTQIVNYTGHTAGWAVNETTLVTTQGICGIKTGTYSNLRTREPVANSREYKRRNGPIRIAFENTALTLEQNFQRVNILRTGSF